MAFTAPWGVTSMCVTSVPVSASSIDTHDARDPDGVSPAVVRGNLGNLPRCGMAVRPQFGEGNFGPGLRADSLITCNDQGQCDGPTQ